MIIFDDIYQDFYPLTLTRPISDLRCGILKLRQRWQAYIDDDSQNIWMDEALKPVFCDRHPDWQINQPASESELMISSRLIANKDNISLVKKLKAGEIILSEGRIAALRLKKAMPFNPYLLASAFADYQSQELPGLLLRHLADLIHASSELIRQDYESFFYDADNSFEVESGVTVLDPYSVWLGEGVTLKPGVVLDASEGPIVIDEGASVMPNAVIVGPCYIGKRSVIKIGAKIYPGTSIGPVCKVGGEVEGSIIQAYSNKQHDGFLGHSFIGEWVNIGADTNNSDLKNTYDKVSFYSYTAATKINSDTMFLGCVIGDHSKLGINCSINTGTVIGVGANLWGNPLIDGFIPDLSWGMANELRPYRVNAFLWTAAQVKQRRKLDLSEAEKTLYKNISLQQ